MPSPAGTVVVIAGMHRSGTSLVASVLREAGAHMGDRLVGPDRGNPRGHFEDADFVEFHQRALFARGQHVRVTPGFTFAPTTAERCEAEALVAARADRPLWGWKDPRTALFLAFWDTLVPGAAYVLPYRHPLDVLLSLVRRADVSYIGLLEAVDAWCEYNRQALAFRRRVPRTLLCHVHGVVADGDAFGRLLRERLQLDLPVSTAMVQALYRPAELQGAAADPADLDAFARLCPEALALLDTLDAEAELPDPSRAASGSVSAARDGVAPAGSVSGGGPDAASRRAGLAGLVSRLAPAAYSALHDEWLAHADERERAVLWLRTQHEADLEEIARWQAEYAQLRESHAHWEAAAAALQTAVRNLEDGKAWLEAQRRADDEARTWLETRVAALETEIERWAAEHARLRDAHVELEAGCRWLQEQRTALLAEVERWRTAHASAEAWARDREELVARLARRLEGRDTP